MIRRDLLFLLSACVLLACIPSGARAMNCSNPTPVACGETLAGNTCDGPTNHDTHPCLSSNMAGPESYFLLELDHGGTVEITVTPPDDYWDEWDPSLVVMPDLQGDCYPSVHAGCVDDVWEGLPEFLEITLPAGRYFLLVDGFYFDSCGDFELQVTCPTSCEGCVDSDQDGHEAYDEQVCPCGDDCDDDDPQRFPGAAEICGDGTDQDCDGEDIACPDCASDLFIQCGDTNIASTENGGARLDGYCGTVDGLWAGNEFVFAYPAQQDGVVTFSLGNTDGEQLDAFAFSGFGVDGVCNKDACVDASTMDSGLGKVVFYAEQGETYYVAVDGRGGDHGPFDYTVTCRHESCTPADELACAGSIIGNTGGEDSALSAYRGVPHHMLGPDLAYGFSVGYDALVTVVLDIDGSSGNPPDLALVVIEDAGDGCLPGATVAASDFDQGEHNPPEVLTFPALADSTYYLVVDAAAPGMFGRYTLDVACVRDCPPGQSDCHGECFDLQNDPRHCGACDNVCAYEHAEDLCVDGACRMGDCDAGFADCDHDDATGCETSIDTNDNCGSCGNACAPPAFCHQGACVDECPGGLSRCGNDCFDLAEDVDHCGACDNACDIPHGTPGCSEGSCTVAGCDDGRDDCNQDPADGCETELGTDENCAGCGDGCTPPNGTGHCQQGQCVLDGCEAGWDDCNQDPADGCEADLGQDANCGACDNACPGGEHCEEGACVENCSDDDGDGHEDAACGGDDCDDGDDAIHPDADEICDDEIDNDCDGMTDCEDRECKNEFPCSCPDGDGDGHHEEACGGDDCDDLDGDIHPDAEENCSDEVDQDCDGLTDCEDSDCEENPACTKDEDGCGCRTTGAGSWPWMLLPGLLGLLALRRRSDGARTSLCSVVFVCGLAAMLPAAAHGQNCPEPTAVTCGQTVEANSCEGPQNHVFQPCLGTSWDGPESVFVLDLEHGARADISLVVPDDFYGEWDAGLVLLPALADDCHPSVHLGCSDAGGMGVDEHVEGILPAGRYFLLIDGWYYDSCGDFELTVDCVACTGCVDADGDGYDAYSGESCPCGTDCNDSDPARNPDADEICGDGYDQDCDGLDAACPVCAGDVHVACDDTGTLSTDSGGSNLGAYCGGTEDRWAGNETVLAFSAAAEGAVTVTVDNMAGQQLDAFAFTGFAGDGPCDKDACVDSSAMDSGTQQIAFYAEQDETYYVAIDGRNGDHGSFDYAVACSQECCSPSGELACGQQVEGDTYGLDNTVSAYRGVDRHMLGPDQAFSFSVDYDAVVDFALSIDSPGDTPPDMALVVLEDDGSGACLPGATVAASDHVQDEHGNPPEVVTLLARAGATYHLVVDASGAGVTGSFTLAAACVRDCPPGQTDCSGVCYDLDSDPDHCGACDNACSYDHATALCVDGACQMGACDEGWADCDDGKWNGCESDLNAADTCGTCTSSCRPDERCQDGVCVPRCEDADRDGHGDAACGGDDCDDTDAGIHPGAAEVCDDGIDNDCDGDTDCDDPECESEQPCSCPDRDGDGHQDAACGGDDCNDLDGYIQPEVDEICTDGVDQDCDGLTDCDDPDCAGHDSCNCVDNDGDGYGEGPGCLGPDCNDKAPQVHPGAFDDCGDGWDQDCDGVDRPCPEKGGCGCHHDPGGTSGNDGLVWLVVLVMALGRRRLQGS